MPEQAQALRELAALWGERPFILIGATALRWEDPDDENQVAAVLSLWRAYELGFRGR